MKIVIAPDSFKESMSGKVACDAIERGLKKVLKDVEFIKVPMADGGEGTTESLVDATGGKIYYTEVTNPLGEKIQGKLEVLGDRETAILEMASASGLELISKEKRNPMVTTTFGTGELIKKALDRNVKIILIGIGGQTRFGKTPYGVAKTAKKYGIPVIALAGNVSEDIDILYDYGFDAIFSILFGVQTLETALKNGEKNLERVSENIGRLILTFKNKNL